MDLEIDPSSGPEGGDPGPGELIMLGLVRMMSLPFLLLLIILASLIYSVASLARIVADLTAVIFHRTEGADRGWDHPVKAQDA